MDLELASERPLDLSWRGKVLVDCVKDYLPPAVDPIFLYTSAGPSQQNKEFFAQQWDYLPKKIVDKGKGRLLNLL